MEERKRSRVCHKDSTRIELRFFNRVKGGEYDLVLRWLLFSLSVPRSSGYGQYIRHIIFTCGLFTHICFEETKQRSSSSRVSKKAVRCSVTGNWSEWYRDLYKVFISGCVSNWRCGYSVKPSTFFSLLHSFKKCPTLTVQGILGILPLSSSAVFSWSKDDCSPFLSDVLKESVISKRKRGRPKGSLDSYKRCRKRVKKYFKVK